MAASPDRYCGTLTLNPGDGFSFYYHSHQDEFVYVIEGRGGRWVGQERAVLGPGDVKFAPAGTVHANFNFSHQPVKLLGE